VEARKEKKRDRRLIHKTTAARIATEQPALLGMAVLQQSTSASATGRDRYGINNRGSGLTFATVGSLLLLLGGDLENLGTILLSNLFKKQTWRFRRRFSVVERAVGGRLSKESAVKGTIGCPRPLGISEVVKLAAP
jgi:hypothetical protein